MPRIVVTHAVEGVERWLAGHAQRASALPGATNVTDLVAMDGSNNAAVAFNIDDLDVLRSALSEMPPSVASEAESHGVITSTIAVYVEA